MNNLTLFTLCLSLISIFIYAPLFYFRVVRPHLKKHLTYSMFEVRDDLILKVAQTKIKVEDPAFKEAYKIINRGIRHYKIITFFNIIRIYNYRLTDELIKEIETRQEIIYNADIAIKECIADFLAAYINILYKTSFLLRFFIFFIPRVEKCYKLCKKLFTHKLFININFQKPSVYRNYYILENYSEQLIAAM